MRGFLCEEDRDKERDMERDRDVVWLIFVGDG